MTITDKNYKDLIANNSVAIKFGAVWCSPCRLFDPIIHKLEAEKHPYILGSVDIDNNSVITTEYGIRNIPVILFFKNGKLVDKHLGVMTEDALRKKLDSVLL